MDTRKAGGEGARGEGQERLAAIPVLAKEKYREPTVISARIGSLLIAFVRICRDGDIPGSLSLRIQSGTHEIGLGLEESKMLLALLKIMIEGGDWTK